MYGVGLGDMKSKRWGIVMKFRLTTEMRYTEYRAQDGAVVIQFAAFLGMRRCARVALWVIGRLG